VFRWFALGAPYSWFGFATHFRCATEVVGADFFQRFARRVHAGFEGHVADMGLMASLDDIRSARFDPTAVHPLIREFYEHTSTFKLDITVEWNPLVKPFGWLYRTLVARQMRQLTVPLDQNTLAGLDSWLDAIDLHHDGKPDFRIWVRVDKDSGIPVYVGAYRTYRSTVDDYDASYVSVCFPVPGGNMTTVLVPLNYDGDGFMLRTHDPKSTESGVYFLLPHGRSFTMAPALGLAERFRLKTYDGQVIMVIHECFWLGMHAFTMHYTITRENPAQREMAVAKNIIAAAGLSPTNDQPARL
jgi:hypothetical protein